MKQTLGGRQVFIREVEQRGEGGIDNLPRAVSAPGQLIKTPLPCAISKVYGPHSCLSRSQILSTSFQAAPISSFDSKDT